MSAKTIDHGIQIGADIGVRGKGGPNTTAALREVNKGFYDDLEVTHVCCIGAGHAGVLSMAVMAENWPEITFTIVDSNQSLIESWQGGEVLFYEPGFEELFSVVMGKNLYFSHEIDAAIQKAHVIFIAVDVAIKAKGIGAGCRFDLTNWESAVRKIMSVSTTPKVVVEKSTVPIDVGNIIMSILGKNQLGLHFSVFSNPDFFSQGTAVQDLREPSRVVIASRHNKGDVFTLQKLYSRWVPIDRIVIVDDHKSVELGKIVVGGFLAMKLTLINVVSSLCDDVGADLNDVQRIIRSDSRVGEKYLDAGIGIGGPGLMKDVSYLKYVLQCYGYEMESKLFEHIIKLNKHRKNMFVDLISKRMISLNEKRIAVFGFSYKKNTDDIRDSPAIDICQSLVKQDAEVRIFDPRVNRNKIKSCFRAGASVCVASTMHQAWANANAALFLVDWDEFQQIDFGAMHNEMSKQAFIFVGCNLGLNYEIIKALGFNLYVAGRPSV